MERQGLILVIGGIADNQLSQFTLEILSLGKRLAKETGDSLALCLLGEDVTSIATQGFQYGADRVIIGESPSLKQYIGDTFANILTPAIKQLNPSLVLTPHDDRGLDLAPRLAFGLGSKAVMDCESVVVSDKNVAFIKPVFGGKATQRIQFTDSPIQLATIREGSVEPHTTMSAVEGNVERLDILSDAIPIKTRIIKKEIDQNLEAANQLKTSNLIVAAGRGVKNEEGVTLAKQAAKALGGAIVGSRPVVDSGWLPYSLQVGLTGKKVHPRLYIAAGISGAIQHMVGCVKSTSIVAINSDKNAPVFNFARYGIVGDCQEVLKGMIDELSQTG